MYQKEITLPVCKGRVWIKSRLERREYKEFIRFNSLLASLMEDKTPEGRQRFQNESADAQDGMIRIFVLRSDEVRAPNGDPISLPDDVERMDAQDNQFLFEAITDAVNEARVDPNAGGSPSGSISGRGPGRRASRSRRS